MNEQLTVKNFGPIKDATVDFKRVTVFIGPTGGGKSTLAKLAAVFRDERLTHPDSAYVEMPVRLYENYGIANYKKSNTNIIRKYGTSTTEFKDGNHNLYLPTSVSNSLDKYLLSAARLINSGFSNISKLSKESEQEIHKALGYLEGYDILHKNLVSSTNPVYIPSERIFCSNLEYSWAGLMRDDIGLPKTLLDFANKFSSAKKDVLELNIPLFNVKYLHIDGRDFIQIPNCEEPLMLLETASGIQSVTPLLVLLEHLSRNTEQAQSFIIEEPELNLYPTAQQGLLNWLVEKCTKGENDLTITTHSPYILSHLNLLLYAYQVAHAHPDRAEEVAQLVPRESWINPQEFACYQVEDGGVTSLVSEELGLIDDNGLDNLSGDAADAFDNLIRLSKAAARK